MGVGGGWKDDTEHRGFLPPEVEREIEGGVQDEAFLLELRFMTFFLLYYNIYSFANH